ncbi:hypothetical protein GCM10022379_19620 [Micromonospora maritima]
MTARGDRITPYGIFGILRDLKAELADIQESEGVEDLDVAERIESVEALIEGMDNSTLGAKWIVENGGTLINDADFEEFCEDDVKENSGHPTHPVWGFVNWEEYADHVRTDWTEVTVGAGEFEGTWWVR